MKCRVAGRILLMACFFDIVLASCSSTRSPERTTGDSVTAAPTEAAATDIPAASTQAPPERATDTPTRATKTPTRATDTPAQATDAPAQATEGDGCAGTDDRCAGTGAPASSSRRGSPEADDSGVIQSGDKSLAAVNDSLLNLFNSSHPVHGRHQHYYGRYSYVVLRDGNDTLKSKNKAFITRLIDLFSATGTRIPFQNANHVSNPLDYNVFFLPVRDESDGRITVREEHGAAADEVLAQYDYGVARAIRREYCGIAKHANRPLCIVPYNDGPFIFTFLRPLARIGDHQNLPPAFAYDFTRVPADQFDEPLAVVQRKIEVPDDILADTVLPPPAAAEVANVLDVLTTALKHGIAGVYTIIDKQPGAKHGE